MWCHDEQSWQSGVLDEQSPLSGNFPRHFGKFISSIQFHWVWTVLHPIPLHYITWSVKVTLFDNFCCTFGSSFPGNGWSKLGERTAGTRIQAFKKIKKYTSPMLVTWPMNITHAAFLCKETLFYYLIHIWNTIISCRCDFSWAEENSTHSMNY